MYDTDFQGLKLPALGFGLMRLPCRDDGSIDQEHFEKMVDYAMTHGVNYFDTAFPYHGGLSELVAGKALAKYPRESYYLATKYPGHQTADRYDPADVFEQQLKKCGVDYFDFYLLHNVYENDIDVYEDPRWGIIDYFVEQRRLGRIRHLGFSCHARPETLRAFLDRHGDVMEFCQIQLNYLDWSLQDAEAKYKILTERGVSVWVMEPVRGGRLAKLPAEDEARLRALRPEESVAAWSFRWLQGLDNVKVVLSGMSSLAQMADNVATYETARPTTDAENEVLYAIADKIARAVPCTACRYCCSGCPVELDIPRLLNVYNDLTLAVSPTVYLQLRSLPEDKQPSACIGCGQCAAICPQGIDIPGYMEALADKLAAVPDWDEVSRQRALDAERLRL